MNYEQKYKFAIEQAKKELDACVSMNCDAAKQIFRLFPELAESKDERIKKEIIRYLDRKIISSNFGGDIATFKEWIDWLKKQGEQITKSKTDWSEKDETTLACLIGTLTWVTNNNYHCSEDIPKYMCWLENLKQRLNR